MKTMHRRNIMEQLKIEQVVKTETVTTIFRRVTRNLSNSIAKTATAIVNLQATDSTAAEAYEKLSAARGQLQRLRLLFCEQQAVILTVMKKLSETDATEAIDELQLSWFETSTRGLMFIKKIEELIEKYDGELKEKRKNPKFVHVTVTQNK